MLLYLKIIEKQFVVSLDNLDCVLHPTGRLTNLPLQPSLSSALNILRLPWMRPLISWS